MSRAPKHQLPKLVLAPDMPDVAEALPQKKQRLAKEILEKNPEFAKVFKIFVKEVRSTANADMVMMGYEMWKENKEIKFRSKPTGIAGGFVVSCDGKPDLFVKTFLGGSASRKSALVELFVYKLLENLGFGAQIFANNYDGILPFVTSKDLRFEGDLVYFGDGAKKILSPIFQEGEGNVECKSAIIALEVLVKILGLGDLSQNGGNYGIVIDSHGLMRPIVVDFHFDPIVGTVISGGTGSNIRLPGLSRDLSTKIKAEESVAVGLTVAAAETNIEERIYDAALEIISEEKLGYAIDSSLRYCQNFVDQISDPELLLKEFNLDDVMEYVDMLWNNFSKLKEEVRSRRSSIATDTLLGESRRGSGVYLDLIGGDPTLYPDPEDAPEEMKSFDASKAPLGVLEKSSAATPSSATNLVVSFGNKADLSRVT